MECQHIPVIGYSEFSKILHHSAAGQRSPITGSIEVTARCNLRCVHCYINLPAGDRNALEKELSSEELFYILDEIADEGCLWLLFTGGEPFIRPDFIDIYTYAKNKGLLITLFTNGTFITPQIADYLAEWPPFSVEITIYGKTQKTYERVTGVPGSYKRCIRSIELLMDRKIPLKIKSMILTLNKHEVWDMKEYAEELGVEFRFDPVLNVRIDGDNKPAKFRLTPEEVVAMDLSDEGRMEGWLDFCERFWGPPPQPEYLYQCGAGFTTFHIDPYGQLSVCMMSRNPSYNLRNGSFREGWYNFIPRIRARRWSRDTVCKACDLIAMCGQCPGWAQMESGDPEKPVEYLCRIAHLRSKSFNLSKNKIKEAEIDGKREARVQQAALS